MIKMEKYDLVIVGAGPAGLTLAKEMAGSNLKILLVDKKKNAEDVQYNTSGSFIDPRKWDLPFGILNPISTVCFNSKNESAVKKVKACIINRKKLLFFIETKARENRNLKIDYEAAIKNFGVSRYGIDRMIYSKNNKDI